jgi:hypothetical protein
VILGQVPAPNDHYWVHIEVADLAKLYIVPCREWYLAPKLQGYDAATTDEVPILIAARN